MATYTVTNKYLIDDFAVLQLLTPSEIAVGQSITVADVDATFNGTYTVRALPQYLFIGVDTEGDLVRTARGIGISFGDEDTTHPDSVSPT